MPGMDGLNTLKIMELAMTQEVKVIIGETVLVQEIKIVEMLDIMSS
jgi:hypothetical protein